MESKVTQGGVGLHEGRVALLLTGLPGGGGVSSAQAGLLHGGFMKKKNSTKVLCIYHFVVKRLRARFTEEFQLLQCLEC